MKYTKWLLYSKITVREYIPYFIYGDESNVALSKVDSKYFVIQISSKFLSISNSIWAIKGATGKIDKIDRLVSAVAGS